MMRFDGQATDAQKAAAVAGIRGLPDSIPEIRSLTVGVDARLREDNFDLAAVADFDSRADYEVYASHPAHIDMLAEVVRPILAERAAVQYEC
jgi:hypothetical protein